MTVDEHLFDDCDYSPDPPPPDDTSNIDGAAIYAGMIVGDLTAAARGDDPAGRLSMALFHLSRIRGELDRSQLMALTTAVVDFAAVAASVMPADVPRQVIHDGMASAFWQVGFKYLSPEAQRDAARDPVNREELADMRDRVRMLRNAAHNSALQEGIRRRQREREQQEAISTFGDDGPGAGPGH